MFRFGHFATILLVLAATPFARASGRESEERAARKACLSGDYVKGVGILSDLFIDTKNPTYIFNQARCFEQNSRCEEAISRFREYLRKATDLSPADRADTEKHIADCQALLGPKDVVAPASKRGENGAESTAPRAEAAPPALPPSSAVPSPPPAEPGLLPVPPSPDPVTVTAVPPPATSPGHGLRIAGIACGAVGVASIGTAIYFYTRATSLSDTVTTSDSPSASDYQSGKTAQTMQWVFYSVGAAALATGSVLYYLGWRAAEPGQTAVTPMVGPGFAGLAAKGAF